MGPSLSLTRVAGLVGGLSLVAAFFMPWFSSQSLLLSGQFLHNFLSSATASDLRTFLPNSSPTEVQLLRLLVDLFPVCGAIAAAAALIGGLTRTTFRLVTSVVWGLSGGICLVAWASGVGRLPTGSNPEIGLWLIGVGSLLILASLVLEIRAGTD